MICGEISIGVRYDPVFIITYDCGHWRGGLTGAGFEEVLTVHVVEYIKEVGF